MYMMRGWSPRLWPELRGHPSAGLLPVGGEGRWDDENLQTFFLGSLKDPLNSLKS